MCWRVYWSIWPLYDSHQSRFLAEGQAFAANIHISSLNQIQTKLRMSSRTEWRCFFCVACTSNKEPAKAVLVRCTVQVAPPSATSPEYARHRHYETEQMTPRNRFNEKHDPTGGACHLFMASKAFGHLQALSIFQLTPQVLELLWNFTSNCKKKQQQFTPLRPLRFIRQILPLGILGEHSTTLEIQRL